MNGTVKNPSFYVFSFLILKTALKIPPKSLGLLMTTIFKPISPYQHLQRIPRTIKATVNNAIINPDVQKCDIIKPTPNAIATAPKPLQPRLCRIKSTAFNSLTPLYARERER